MQPNQEGQQMDGYFHSVYQQDFSKCCGLIFKKLQPEIQLGIGNNRLDFESSVQKLWVLLPFLILIP